jgi:hypothetical protein
MPVLFEVLLVRLPELQLRYLHILWRIPCILVPVAVVSIVAVIFDLNVVVANAKFSLLKLLIYEPYYLCLSRLECQA